MNNPPVWEIPAFNWEIIRSDWEIDILMRGLAKFCGMLTAPLKDSGGLTAPNEDPVLVIDSLSKALTYCRMKTSRCKDPGFCRKVGFHKQKIQLLPKNRFPQTKSPVAAEKSIATNKSTSAIHFQGIDPHTKFLAQFSKFDGMGPCFIKRSGHE